MKILNKMIVIILVSMTIVLVGCREKELDLPEFFGGEYYIDERIIIENESYIHSLPLISRNEIKSFEIKSFEGINTENMNISYSFILIDSYKKYNLYYINLIVKEFEPLLEGDYVLIEKIVCDIDGVLKDYEINHLKLIKKNYDNYGNGIIYYETPLAIPTHSKWYDINIGVNKDIDIKSMNFEFTNNVIISEDNMNNINKLNNKTEHTLNYMFNLKYDFEYSKYSIVIFNLIITYSYLDSDERLWSSPFHVTYGNMRESNFRKLIDEAQILWKIKLKTFWAIY